MTDAAASDFRQAVQWSAQQFSARQARSYAKTLGAALDALMSGPGIVGVRHRDDIAKGLMALHVARGRRRGRHFIIFRVGSQTDPRVIEVLRLLHDAMDLEGHV